MTTRVDQRGKNQQQQNHQVNGGVRIEEYDYGHAPMRGQPHTQQAQYNATMQQMSSPTTDTYMSGYYTQALNYPGFFDASAWSTSSQDTLPYLGNYSQQMGSDYMPFPSYDYSGGAFWSGYADPSYASWTAPHQQHDPMKIPPGGQPYMPTMDQLYSETYHSPTGGHQNHVTNGQEAAAAAVSEPDEIIELEQGLQMVSVNGHSEVNQESLSETSVTEPSLSNVNNSSVMPAASPTGQPAAPKSWANIAKQPAKPVTNPPKIMTRPQAPKVSHDNNWEKAPRGNSGPSGQRAWSAPRSHRNGTGASNFDKSSNHRQTSGNEADSDPTLSKLKLSNAYNPKSFETAPKNARFFVIKSYSEDDIHRAIKYGVWCSTEHGNKRLDAAFKEREGKGPIYLFYSVNGSGHFCGMAQMMSGVDYQTHAGVWTQDKWKGSMEITWIYVKDVPNSALRNIRLENNENKPVTNSRDTQEVLPEKGRQVLKIIHQFKHTTSIFDDFGHYEKKEVEESGDSADKKKPSPKLANGSRN